MATIGEIEYQTITGTVAAISTFNDAVNAAIDDGYAMIDKGPVTNGMTIQVVMMKGAASTFISQYFVTDVAVGPPSILTISGNEILNFNPGYKFTVQASTGNNGTYTVTSTETVDRTVSYAITAVTTGAGGSFTIAGVLGFEFVVGSTFEISGSSNNDGVWTVAAVDDGSGNTVINVEETVGAVADGDIVSIFSTEITIKETLASAVGDGEIVAYAASVGP